MAEFSTLDDRKYTEILNSCNFENQLRYSKKKPIRPYLIKLFSAITSIVNENQQ